MRTPWLEMSIADELQRLAMWLLAGIPWFEIGVIIAGLIFLLYLEGYTHGLRWRWLCYVFPHRWCFVGNRDMETYEDESHRFGLYQCKRCEQLSVGSPR